jgi:hypothetical protein
MKRILGIFLGLYATVMVVACQNGNNNDDTVVQPPAQVGCPAGTYFNNGYCYTQQQQIVSTGSVGFNSEFGFGQENLRITSSGIYRLVLREAFAICDRDAYNSGLSSCDSYLNGYARFTIQAVSPDATALRLTMEVGPRSSYNYGWHNVSMPTGGQLATCGLTYILTGVCYTYATSGQMTIPRNPLALDMAVSPINASKGFEGRAYGAWGTVAQNKLFQLMVDTGKLADGFIDYRLSYNGQANGVFAEGRMLRCGGGTGATCGLTAW